MSWAEKAKEKRVGKLEAQLGSFRRLFIYFFVAPSFFFGQGGSCKELKEAKEDVFQPKTHLYKIVLLHIISGKKNGSVYGSDESLSLLEHAYELWKDGRGMEIMDPSLDDTFSSCGRIIR
uniref:Uncharacterized protein n=1 Tax=Salix viminalis TaxID=40686 RepID=A0A6N2LXU5_SALVM